MSSYPRRGRTRATGALVVAAAALVVTSACTAADQGTTAPPASSSAAAPTEPPSGSPSATPSASSACPPGGRPEDSTGCLADAVVGAVVERLAVMPEVAQAKYAAGLPVEDAARERQARRAFVAATGDGGVARPVARAVITDQFDAAKAVQRALIDAWGAGAMPAPTGPPPDLAEDLRPRIDTATTALADALVVLSRDGVPPGWATALADAQGRALPALPEGVTAVDLTLALSTLDELPG